MLHTDAQLIQRTLSGDETAFASLVRKYEKKVHALVYRKIGDFQDAQELTQDTFLRAFENLSTLRDFDLFAGWLYVIASRVCVSWLRQQKPVMQSLEGMSIKERDTLSYSRYVSKQVGRDAIEALQDRVKKCSECFQSMNAGSLGFTISVKCGCRRLAHPWVCQRTP